MLGHLPLQLTTVASSTLSSQQTEPEPSALLEKSQKETKGATKRKRYSNEEKGSGLEKRQATLQIGLRAGVDDLGNNLPQPPIAIIFRGTGKRISEAEKRAYDPRVLVYFQKCAWVDRTTAIEWQNGTLIPWLNEHIPHEESGAGREVKHDVDYEDEWLEDGENLQKYFTKSGCNITATGEGDDAITPEGLDTFTFERPTILAVIQEMPVQHLVAPISHTEMQEEVEEPELQELDSEESEDECTDEEEKWFLPDGFVTVKDAPSANQLNYSMVGRHIMFKWNGVGWCHGVKGDRVPVSAVSSATPHAHMSLAGSYTTTGRWRQTKTPIR
ncbi:hypothetical protein CYMTET_33845 [Cymbomonas tetramitiformis]|uniref:Uncharacterized protein n=1 Tax=Cymbomonas tetramitiformis TaxID=36881 RepID=A0AAE0FCU0_9CHLO|nr:hypothetical protein CYMTET_33845 [Cymbomonas tetramitiformis]